MGVTAGSAVPGASAAGGGDTGPAGSPSAERTVPPDPTGAHSPVPTRRSGGPRRSRTGTNAQARVWRAATVVTRDGAGRADDPVRADRGHPITAIGWCAPVDGPDRPPLGPGGDALPDPGRRRDGGAVRSPRARRARRARRVVGPEAAGVGNHPAWPVGPLRDRAAEPERIVRPLPGSGTLGSGRPGVARSRSEPGGVRARCVRARCVRARPSEPGPSEPGAASAPISP